MAHDTSDEGSGAVTRRIYRVPTEQSRAFGHRLRVARVAAQMRQSDLAVAVGFKQPNTGAQVSLWERGRIIPRPQTVARLAAALNTTPAYLLGYVDDAPQEEKGCKRCGMARDLLTAALGAAARTNDADLRRVLIAPLQRLLATMQHGASGEVDGNECEHA